MMKKNVKVAALLFCGAMSVTSCQGLVDAIFPNEPDAVNKPALPEPEADSGETVENNVAIMGRLYTAKALSDISKFFESEEVKQLVEKSSSSDPVVVTVKTSASLSSTVADNTITLPFVNGANIIMEFMNPVYTTSDRELSIRIPEGREGERSNLTIVMPKSDNVYLEMIAPSTALKLEGPDGVSYKRVLISSAPTPIVMGRGVTTEELEIYRGRYNQSLKGAVKHVTYKYTPLTIKDAANGFGVQAVEGERRIAVCEFSKYYAATEEDLKTISISATSSNPKVAAITEGDGRTRHCFGVHAISAGQADVTVSIEGDEYLKSKFKVFSGNIKAPSLGQVIGSDGLNYTVGHVPTGVTPVAVIAYISENSGNHGLALSLGDEGSYNWGGSMAACERKPVVAGIYSWHLPSLDDWRKMLIANGGDVKSHAGLSKIIVAAGGIGFVQRRAYWSSQTVARSEFNAPDKAILLHLNEGPVSDFAVEMFSDIPIARACFAF